MFIFVKGKFDFLRPPSCFFSFLLPIERETRIITERHWIYTTRCEVIRSRRQWRKKKGEKMVSFFSGAEATRREKHQSRKNKSKRTYPLQKERKQGSDLYSRGDVGISEKRISSRCSPFTVYTLTHWSAARLLLVCVYIFDFCLYISHFLILFSPYGGTSSRETELDVFFL